MSNPFSCSNFVDQNADRRGIPGYFTDCSYNTGCDAGYTQIDQCDWYEGPYCKDKCPGSQTGGYCGASPQNRRVCQKNLDSFGPYKNGTLIPDCCTITDQNQRKLNDCPPTYFPNSDACNDTILSTCKTNIIQPICETLAKSTNQYVVQEYNQLMNTYCLANVDNLNNQICLDWCKNNPDNCTRQNIQNLCNGSNVIGNPTYSKACGCFYPATLYEQAAAGISASYNVPSGFLGGGRACYFPLCQAAELQYDGPGYTCPSLDLVNCIQKIDIDAQDAKIGAITINQNAQCGVFSKKCPSGECSPEQETVTCQRDADCAVGQTCVAGDCVPAPRSYTTIIIIVVAVVVCLIILSLVSGLLITYNKKRV